MPDASKPSATAAAATAKTYQPGDRLQTMSPNPTLPALPAGLKWVLDGVLESLPPKYVYRVETDRPFTPAPSSPPGSRFTLRPGQSVNDLPKLREGFQWVFSGKDFVVEAKPPESRRPVEDRLMGF